jgi:hypothetical protein
MFNNSAFKRIQVISLLCCVLCIYSCKEEVVINFSETNILVENETVVEINIPKVDGKTTASKNINTILEAFVNDALTIDAAKTAKASIKENITALSESYKTFKKQLEDLSITDLPVWEAIVDGEVLYKNEAMVCIAMNATINTGGAHSNIVTQFLNFDVNSGKSLGFQELFNDVEGFKTVVKKYYDKELLTGYVNPNVDFKGKDFQLPKTIGFSEDGVIIFYDTLTPSDEPLEFTIPYEVANKFLKV